MIKVHWVQTPWNISTGLNSYTDEPCRLTIVLSLMMAQLLLISVTGHNFTSVLVNTLLLLYMHTGTNGLTIKFRRIEDGSKKQNK